MASKSSAFASGFMGAYSTVSRGMREQERWDLEKAKLQEEAAMNAELKEAGKDVKPAEGFIVTGADGTKSMFADEAAATKALHAMGDGATMANTFIVNGQAFQDKDAAQGAADAANTPGARLRARADIALKYNKPELADAYQKNYRNLMEANRRDMQEKFLQARQDNNVGAVLDNINARLAKSGQQAALVPTDNGYVYQISRGDQIMSATPVENMDKFWDTMHQHVMDTPDNLLESWKVRRGLEQQDRIIGQGDKRVENDTRKTDADIEASQARTRQGDAQLQLSSRKLDADVAYQNSSLGLQGRQIDIAQQNSNVAYFNAHKPTVVSGVDPNNNTVFSTTELYGVPGGGYGLRVGEPQVVQGMAPMRTAGPSLMIPGLNGAAPTGPATGGVDPKYFATFGGKNIGGAPAPSQPPAQPPVPATGLQGSGIGWWSPQTAKPVPIVPQR